MRALRVLAVFFLVSFVLLSVAQAERRGHKETKIINNQGKEIGTLKLTEGTEGLLINIKVKDLSPGYHGMHFHKTGDCSDHKEFKNSGGHVDPFKKPHGFLNNEGPHEGNLPNLVVSKDGTAEVELYTNLASLLTGPALLLDDDGSALIIHANRDDHKSQPIGGSGARVACSVIKK